MRVAVIGGTGLVGRHTIAALRRDGHRPVVIARSQGIDVVTGEGLAEALDGVQAVIDASNTMTTDAHEAAEFFNASTTQILAAEERTGVGHHVVLSIVGLDRVEGNAHYAGKREQERVALAGSVPTTILRATQFFDFAGMVVGWTQKGDAAMVPPLLVQPVAVADVANALIDIALRAPDRVQEIAGPETHDLVDMARRTLSARGESLRLIASWRGGPFGTDMAGEVLLPGPEARIGATSFESWLAEIRAAS